MHPIRQSPYQGNFIFPAILIKKPGKSGLFEDGLFIWREFRRSAKRYWSKLILDEPTAGLDPKERVRFRNILSVLSKDRIVILSTHIVSDIESIANHVIMIKEKQLLKNDTVPNICKELEGKVFEKSINESKIQEFEQKRIILSMRQESEKMMVRYYSEEEDNNARPCTPNLEDVFLVTYREEK